MKSEIIKLLIVDDDESIQKHLKPFFDGRGYLVETASDGPTAIAKMELFHPQLMFLDIGLPGMSGLDVLKKVKEKAPAVRVIMITAQTDDELIRKAEALGADDYVFKPFTLEYLVETVMEKLKRQVMSDYYVEREKFTQFFHLSPDGAAVLDDQLNILEANPAARLVLGLPREFPAVSLPAAFDAFHYDPSTSLTDFDWLSHINKRFDLVRGGPFTLTLECTLTCILDAHGDRPKNYILMLKDVTEIRKEWATKNRVIALFNHKLRTPLTGLIAISILLDQEFVQSLTPRQQELAQAILKNFQCLKKTIDDVLLLSPLDVHPENTNALSLFTEAQRRLAEEPVDGNAKGVVLDPSLADVQVHADPFRVSFAIYEILQNAFKFGASNIRVSAFQEKPDFAVFRISDDGRGIPPEEFQHIFKAFYQVDKGFVGNVDGIGHGLAFVKQVIEAHGGTASVESALQKGSVFSITLPLAKSLGK